MNARELRAQRATVLESAKAMVDKAEGENRDLSAEEQNSYDGLLSQAESLEKRAVRLESLPEGGEPAEGRRAPAVLKTKLGDDETKALAHFVRTGDVGAVRSMVVDDPEDRSGGKSVEIKLPKMDTRAVTDSTMNITTAGDGGNVVPTGFAGRIAARRGEVRLAEKLGVQMVPGKGTTVNFPFENADAQALAATAEQSDAHGNNYGRDAMQFDVRAFTLAKKTKKIELTEELLNDEDANVMAFIADNIGRAIGLTHNAALVAEVIAHGTSLKTFASATAIAAGEPDALVFNDTISPYLDDGGSIAWVMRPSTFGAIRVLSGDPRVYSPAAGQGRTLLEYPVQYSNQVAAIADAAKTVLFGNWFFMGLYEDQALHLIYDPYTVDGMTVLKYSIRLAYGQLIAGAIGYGVQAHVG